MGMKGVATDASERGGGMNVLQVDPEATRSRRVSQSFESAGYRVKTVGTGGEGARLGAACRPDVLITAWLLPETWFHGLHLAAALRRDHPEMRVLLTTEVATPDVGFDALESGIHDILPRAVSPKRLVGAVRAATAREPQARWQRSFYPDSLLERILQQEPPEPGKDCPFGRRALIVDPSTWTRRLGVRELERIFCVAHSVAEPDWALRILEWDPQIDLVIFDVDWDRGEVKNLVERLMVHHPQVLRIAQGRDPSRLRQLSWKPEHFLQLPWSGKALMDLLLSGECYDQPATEEARSAERSEPAGETGEPPAEPTPERPNLADGRERRLDPRSVTAARIAGGIGAAATFVGTTLALGILLWADPFGRIGRFVLFGAWVFLNGLISSHAWFWPPLSYRYTAWKLDEQGMGIRRGVLWRSEISVPKSRVQHTDVSRGPLQRAFGIATLVIHTAGTQNASVPLSGLSYEDALAIRDHLIEGGDDDGV